MFRPHLIQVQLIKRHLRFSSATLIVPRRFATTLKTLVEPISNRKEILADVDKILTKNKPPALEYIYVNPYYASFATFQSHSAQNPYGHSAIRYTLPSGEQKLMNIVGLKGAEMVNFMKPEDYLIGLPEETKAFGSEQGGVYHRSFISVRIEELPDENIIKMDNFYVILRRDPVYKVKKYWQALVWLGDQ